MGLRKYFSKRNFARTPEPKGGASKRSSKKLAFVVQEHHATTLHYDFRLELGGVLKSWAVPKGPSMDPHDRHLAMMVEDHPYSYRTFEGTIPEGNYGAGTVSIWDKGTYEPRTDTADPEKELRKGLKKGHITFVMHGAKLHGEFALIKMRNAKEKNAWLLVKKGDRDAYETDQPIAFTLNDYPKVPAPEVIRPMLCTLVDQPFDRENWLFEMKWDGYRAVGAKRGSNVQLYSRNNLDFRAKYPEVVEALQVLPDGTVIDGEIVAVDKDGRPHFERLQNWGKNKEGELRYYAFDLLWFKGHDVRSAPLLERKQLLRDVIPPQSAIKYSDHITEKGTKFFKEIQKAQLEGIVAKRTDSPYQDGKRGADWLKIKTHLRQEVVIAGFTEPRGSRQHLGSLLLGIYKDGELVYTGHSGGGIPDEARKELRQKLDKLEIKTSPFTATPKLDASTHFTKPQLVCEVSFSEWTKEGYMRHPVFEGMRPDKKPADVHKETAKQNGSAAAHTKELGDLTLTNLDKIFWPEKHYTKGDLIAYYEQIAPTMLPYLKDRPQSMLRHPGGYKGSHFFQKDVTFHLPSGEKTVLVSSDAGDVDYLVATSKQSLLLMAQLGCIEINPWSSRVGSLDKPDWGVIDLDPEGVQFSTVIKVAQTVREVCDELGVPAYPKTSGKTGIHIFIPMGANYTYEQVKNFVHLLVIEVNKRQPKLTSLERLPAKRRHRVYLDYLQNNEGQTLASVYSVRPTKDASVSTPLMWDEVKEGLKPSDFTIKNMDARLKKVGDLWKPVTGKGIDMQKILRKIENDNAQ
jgi:bifunctional non-homologous end joining protein LigD